MRVRILPSLLFALMVAFAVRADAQSDLVVVELFTSQGCSSCPPAEQYLGELALRDDVLALEYHVDYWDYIGWKDEFAQAAFTQRQRRYSRRLGSRYVYTPQIVIGGAAHEVGSNRVAVENQMVKQRRERENAHMAPHVALQHVDGRLLITVEGQTTSAYDILLATFDGSHETKVTRGENAGRTLVNSNVVRTLDVVGEWRGGPMQLELSLSDLPGDAGCAILLQEPDGGRIVAAGRLMFNHGG